METYNYYNVYISLVQVIVSASSQIMHHTISVGHSKINNKSLITIHCTHMKIMVHEIIADYGKYHQSLITLHTYASGKAIGSVRLSVCSTKIARSGDLARYLGDS